MTRTDRILLTSMLTLIMLRLVVVYPLPNLPGTAIVFLFAAVAAAFALRRDVQP